MKNVLIISLCLLIVIASVSIYDKLFMPRTAYINIKEVFNGFELKKEYEKKFNISRNMRKKIIDSLEMELKILGRKIESEGEKNKEDINRFSVKRENYFEKKRILEEDNDKQTKEYDSEIILQMNQYVKDYGKENNYTYIYGVDLNGSLMYAKENKNITKEIIEYINQRYKGF